MRVRVAVQLFDKNLQSSHSERSLWRSQPQHDMPYSSFSFIYVNQKELKKNICAQRGARTHDPEINTPFTPTKPCLIKRSFTKLGFIKHV